MGNEITTDSAKCIARMREIVGQEKLDVLADVFSAASGNPPMVNIRRYRADHPQWMDALDSLESTDQFLRRDTSCQNYQIAVYALPLLECDKSTRLLDTAEAIFSRLSALYTDRLDAQIFVDELIADANVDVGIGKETLFYIADLHDVFAGRSLNFPYGEESHFGLSERVLVRQSILDIICDYYRWHYINPRQRLESASSKDWFARHHEDASAFFDEVDSNGLPKWFPELQESDQVLIMEIDAALKDGLTALPVMGLRALLDSAVRAKIGDKGSFSENLKAFYRAGHITQSHKDLLLAAFDAGSAAIHRSYVPDEDDVKACLEMVKHLLHGLHVVEPKVIDMKRRVPPREIS